MSKQFTMFVGRYNPPANTGSEQLRGKVLVVSRMNFRQTGLYQNGDREWYVLPVGAQSVKVSATYAFDNKGMPESHFDILEELDSGTNANHVDINDYD